MAKEVESEKIATLTMRGILVLEVVHSLDKINEGCRPASGTFQSSSCMFFPVD